MRVCELPRRPRGIYAKERFRTVEVVTNFYPVSIKPIKEIHIFKIIFTPQVMNDDRATRERLLSKAMPDIKLSIRTLFVTQVIQLLVVSTSTRYIHP